MNIEEQSEHQATGPVWAIPMLAVASLMVIVSASCCVIPIGLSIVGLGGTWLAVLGPFVAYRSIIQIGVGLVLIFAWARLIKRRDGCTRRQRMTLTFATFCTVVFLIALSAPLWEQDAAQAMLSYWRRS